MGLSRQRRRKPKALDPHVKLSVAFRTYIDSLGDRPAVTLGELAEALGERSILVAIVLFTLPNCLPAPPGIGSVFALPVLAATWQLVRGYPNLRLPAGLARRQISMRTLRWIANRGLVPLAWIETRCAPRLQRLVAPRTHRLLGVAILLLAVVVAFPGPGTNFLPAWAILVVAVGVIEDDGLVVLGGLLFGIFAVVTALGASLALIGGAYFAADWLFAS